MDLPVSDLIWHIYQWVELQKAIHPESNPHNVPGFEGMEYELVNGE